MEDDGEAPGTSGEACGGRERLPDGAPAEADSGDAPVRLRWTIERGKRSVRIREEREVCWCTLFRRRGPVYIASTVRAEGSRVDHGGGCASSEGARRGQGCVQGIMAIL